MGTKKILNVKHDFWKQTSKHKRMLLVGVHLHEKRGNNVNLTFIFTHTSETNSSF